VLLHLQMSFSMYFSLSLLDPLGCERLNQVCGF